MKLLAIGMSAATNWTPDFMRLVMNATSRNSRSSSAMSQPGAVDPAGLHRRGELGTVVALAGFDLDEGGGHRAVRSEPCNGSLLGFQSQAAAALLPGRDAVVGDVAFHRELIQPGSLLLA